MSRETHRSIGAIIGLAVGVGVMYLLGIGGVLPGAIFGAGGALAGGIVGERVHSIRSGR